MRRVGAEPEWPNLWSMIGPLLLILCFDWLIVSTPHPLSEPCLIIGENAINVIRDSLVLFYSSMKLYVYVYLLMELLL